MEITLDCLDLEATINFYIHELGFRLDMIMPADAPRISLVSGHGIRLRIQQIPKESSHCALIAPRFSSPEERSHNSDVSAEQDPGETAFIAKGCGSPASTLPVVSRPLIARANEERIESAGRAGMHYRDLIPGRLHGQVIASHIRIIEGGPVDDYVHYHKVGMQMIYCRRGWVRVVYEDQGEPFVMQAGDCVLQPPTIRHRVFESSAGLEVIELGTPAEHETWRDHDLVLPTDAVRPQRLFQGQRFVRHIANNAPWVVLADGVRCRETDIDSATGSMAGARTIELGHRDGQSASYCSQTADFRFLFVLDGEIVLDLDSGQPIELATDDACVLPSRSRYSLRTVSPATLLEISLPAAGELLQ